MEFFNTNTKKLYRLQADLTTWTLELDLSSGTAVVAKASSADTAGKALKDANGKDISTYAAKLESDVNNAFIINFYDGNNNKLGSVTIPETKVETMTGASASSAGKVGLVPQPKAGDNDKFLCGDGSFKEAGKVKSVNGKTGDVVVDTLPVGTSIMYSGDTVPDGYLAENGAEVSRTTYAKLFAAIGTKYGVGNRSTTFNLPNRNNGSFPEGSDTAGTVKSAGLPNIEGYLQLKGSGNSGFYSDKTSGAFGFETNTAKTHFSNSSTSAATRNAITFSASLSNAIYGNSDTVQPKSVTVKFCIKY
jgi:microcystin-dependent protein